MSAPHGQCNVFHAIRIAKFLLIAGVFASALFVILNSNGSDHPRTRNSFVLARTIVIDDLCANALTKGPTGHSPPSQCALPIQVAIFIGRNATSASRLSIANPYLDVAFLVEDVPERDYLLFIAAKANQSSIAVKRFPTRFVEMVLGNAHFALEVPSEPDRFRQQWRNGRFIECQIVLQRNETELKRFLPLTMIDRAAELTAHMALFNVTGFLFGGTLLGWRRECSLIPHTGDIDLAMFVEEHSPALLQSLIRSQKFLLKWILGHPRQSMEITLWMDNYKTDIFYVYFNATRQQNYMCGMRVEKRQRIRWFYPRFEGLCTGALRNHLFHIPCNFDAIIEAEYGKEQWKEDFPTSQFFWDKSHKNKESGEVIPEQQWEGMHNVYWPKEEHNQTLPEWD